MTFDEILDQAITLLRRQGRVSYPALKIRFGLDDAYLEALKAELYRLQGELRLMLATDNAAEAETCFRQAFDIARSQQAKSPELRAATSTAWRK